MHYSIAELERYTGIKAHTIRMWEQRYDVVTPHRTDTNIRYYDDEQLRKLLNVASLVRGGMRISKISKLSDDEVCEVLDEMAGNENPDLAYVRETNDLLTSALTFDEELFQKTFANCLLKYGLEDTYIHVLNPLLTRTGLMWSTGELSVCQEHFISNLVRQKLFTAADKLSNPKDDAETWVLFLPDSEEHDIGLLYANFLIRQQGKKVIYLGQRVPTFELKENIERLAPDYLLTFIQHSKNASAVQSYIERLASELADYPVFVAGNPGFLKRLNTAGKVKFLENPGHLMTLM